VPTSSIFCPFWHVFFAGPAPPPPDQTEHSSKARCPPFSLIPPGQTFLEIDGLPSSHQSRLPLGQWRRGRPASLVLLQGFCGYPTPFFACSTDLPSCQEAKELRSPLFFCPFSGILSNFLLVMPMAPPFCHQQCCLMASLFGR